jgi:hypothetical protein
MGVIMSNTGDNACKTVPEDIGNQKGHISVFKNEDCRCSFQIPSSTCEDESQEEIVSKERMPS